MACNEHRGFDHPTCYYCGEARKRQIADQKKINTDQAEKVGAAMVGAAAFNDYLAQQRERRREEARQFRFEQKTPCPGACGFSIAMCRCLDLPCIGGCGKLGRNCECHLNVWCDTCENQKRNCHCPEPPTPSYVFIFTPIILVAWIAYLIFVPSSYWDSITFAPGPFYWMRVIFIGGILALVVGSEMEANDNAWKAKWNAYQNSIDMIKETAKRRRIANSSDPPF